MNVRNEPKPINWRKYFWMGLVLLVVAYAYGSPTLEKWTGLDLPSLMDEVPVRGNAAKNESDFELNSSPPMEPDKTTDHGGLSAENSLELKKIGRNQYESPAGLIYAMGPKGEHRVDHIMRHAQDDQSRPVHSVFEGDRNSILQLIDDAYELIKSGSKRVQSSRNGDRVEYTVDMQQKIGYEGGKKGKQNNFPSLRRLRLVLQDQNFVVTAYPYR